ncbi:hypothetical protein [Gluconobacter wancherniae]|uniref:Uncharacterized protein n=1 Tax=Gluconobacter wancherniae NBRC 103581 TaxID=656744 RepID=A0A511B1S4_9PROT|nr:hypothetical protein [Gluconobacter wancherniae]MBF0854543.1 hypothetical protein [Gluconobacter wancherniae]MBS1089648.1 hypothetical protein [Gluconobacter wancherniae]MBS1095730.1 hypothetical protein [Gluconobacter wancherniae]GBD57732.1 hypothetical protein NBRC103581_02324 [Gluconobacter wancherniae NBRC 103581]GBR62405.1 hypothetical protein AA103581_0292 [Gluconobacter wancherniae NBRC 103581]
MKDASFPWVDRAGEPVACAEKVKVLRENDAELRQALQDAFEDGVLMGVTPASMRATFEDMLSSLIDPTQEGRS